MVQQKIQSQVKSVTLNTSCLWSLCNIKNSYTNTRKCAHPLISVLCTLSCIQHSTQKTVGNVQFTNNIFFIPSEGSFQISLEQVIHAQLMHVWLKHHYSVSMLCLTLCRGKALCVGCVPHVTPQLLEPSTNCPPPLYQILRRDMLGC